MNGVELHLQAHELGIRKGDNVIIKNISVSFPGNATTVILGPSGSGKSTLLKAAAGLIPPSTGQMLLNGVDLDKMSKRELLIFRRSSGFVFQDAALWANTTIYQNLRLPLKFHFRELDEDEIERRIENLITRIGYINELHAIPADLSTGEQKLISFARAIIADPSILYMDAPTLSIDSNGAQRLATIIRDLKTRQKTIIATTHDPGLASLVADYLIIMDAGKILTKGPFSEVINSTAPEVAKILTEVLSQASSFDNNILDLLSTTDDLLDQN